MRLAWAVARRYLAPRRRGRFLSFITWVSLGGVTVGVTALIVVIAVMSGAKEDFLENILETTPHILVLEVSDVLRMDNWRPVLDSVRATKDVVSATPFVLTEVAINRVQGYAQPAKLYGIAVEGLGEAATGIEKQVLKGELSLGETDSGLPPIIMGAGLADLMSIFPGDTPTLMSMEKYRPDPFGVGIIPNAGLFQVTQTFSTGFYDYDNEFLYARMEDVQDLLQIREIDRVSGIGARTNEPWRALELADEIQEDLGFGYRVQSWADINGALFSALALEKLAMWVILFLIVVVASFNIVSTLIMVVVERTAEIGILKAMGMTDRRIVQVFVLQGTWIGVVGTSIGIGLGCLLAWLLDTYELIPIPPDVYFVDRLPVSLHLLDVMLIFLASVAVAFAATVYPARQASKLEPVEAIRNE